MFGARAGNAGGQAGFVLEPLEPGHRLGFAFAAQFDAADVVAVGPQVARVLEGAAVEEIAAQLAQVAFARVLDQLALQFGDGFFGGTAACFFKQAVERLVRQHDGGCSFHRFGFR